MYFVYVIKDLNSGKLYKGLTNNLERRLNQRKTEKKTDLRLVYVELSETRDEARKSEKFFKSGYGRETLKELI